MRLAVTGGTGLVGRFIVEEALAAGDRVTCLSRRAPGAGFFSVPCDHRAYDLMGAVPDLTGQDVLIHAAFRHVPGKYRGGEGDDAEGFRRANVAGSLRLFEAARAAGVGRIIFVSSRAVYGAYPPGTRLREDMEPRPDTLYGEVKRTVEQALGDMAGPGCATASVRATGVYGPAGPGQAHKWHDLFEQFCAGAPIAPRVATEVHGRDLAAAVRLVLASEPRAWSGQVFNLSDLVLDRRDLLAEVARLTGVTHDLPARADAARVSAMDCTRLRALGWRPGGMPALRATLPEMLEGLTQRSDR